MSRLETQEVRHSYDRAQAVLDGMSLQIPDGRITSVIGPNGCGKSTLLRTLARLLIPQSGAVLLDGEAIHHWSTKEVARSLGLLPQQGSAPGSISVEDLVRRGRFPHQAPFRPFSRHDQAAVERALELAGVKDLRERMIDELSGGQRQRVWIAMTLAQETPILLLDEPTTFLDPAHRMEVLDLLRTLNRRDGKTVVVVVHDVNEATAISDNVIAMRDGHIVAEGTSEEVLRPDVISGVFGVRCRSINHPHCPFPCTFPVSSRSEDVVPATGRASQTDTDAAAPASHAAVRTVDLNAGYEARHVLSDVSVSVPRGAVTAVVGPNACGKSTLLRVIARLLRPEGGAVILHGESLEAIPRQRLAREVRMLEQSMDVPADITVEDLVGIGRFPYQRWYRQWTRRDREVIARSLRAVGMEDHSGRPVQTLSGGQRRRAWLAMALTQETEVLLLDEPTTFLDIAHQVEVLDLIWSLNRDHSRTTVLVLHDLSQACRYADHVVVMSGGRVAAEGAPNDIVTKQLVQEVFGIDTEVFPDPATGRIVVLPRWELPASIGA